MLPLIVVVVIRSVKHIVKGDSMLLARKHFGEPGLGWLAPKAGFVSG